MGIVVSIIGILLLPVAIVLAIIVGAARCLDFILKWTAVGVLAIVAIAGVIVCHIFCLPCTLGVAFHGWCSKKREKKQEEKDNNDKDVDEKEVKERHETAA